MMIALMHEHYEEEHLQDVISQMQVLGAPEIHAVWMECYGVWVALEGSHRIRAAKALGLTPEIIEVEYSDDFIHATVPDDGGENYMISEICDDAHNSLIIDF